MPNAYSLMYLSWFAGMITEFWVGWFRLSWW